METRFTRAKAMHMLRNTTDVKTLAKNYGESTVKDTLKLNILLMKVRDIICENVKTKKGSAPTTTVETTTAASTTAASTETTKAAETTTK